jgi:hypothetical protein
MHDVARTHNEPMVERYIEIAGRITALVVGTYALEMILQGAGSGGLVAGYKMNVEGLYR